MDYIFLLTGRKFRHIDINANVNKVNIKKDSIPQGQEPTHQQHEKVEPQTHSSEEDDGFTSSHSKSTQEEQDLSDYQVAWDGLDDPLNPKNWPMWKKNLTLTIASFIAIVITANSSIFSAGGGVAAKQYHVGAAVGDLCSAVFLLGFAAGSVIFAPLSEVYGRLPIYSCTLIIFTLFQIGGGLSQNIWSLIIFRFIHGFFACTPMSACGGTVSDLYSPVERTSALLFFCACAFVGPLTGPTIGGFITDSKLGWRWDFWINMIWAALTWVIVIFVMPESHGSTILDFKARYLRKTTSCSLWYNEHERQRSVTNAIRTSLTRGIKLLSTEAIVQAICLYLVFVNVLLYMVNVGYPMMFAQYGFNPGEEGLAMLGVDVGIFVGFAFTPLIHIHYKKRFKLNNGNVRPEDRLWPLFFGSFFIPIGLFWLAWTCYPSVHWAAPLVSGVFLGWGFLYVLQACYAYLVDSYHELAASALAVGTTTRYAAGGGMTVVARPMYNNLNYHWATSLLAFIGCALVPIPFLFFFFGKRIRQRSSHAYKGG
ncbi:membrane transporter [Schizosaccharomyces octosporus yFS286]|uniref:Membrane transporter n=1 Tax=Schizosaccharomyces octosporus (strain yFS286) TaxID=483514 RepID=S9PWD4_SCHOY|nr:membrane transporter [Schizosaccharomyces octosporus yFS286]EPX71793.1 membrane transporter [Schizosaccharomyces octosporus yFS286]